MVHGSFGVNDLLVKFFGQYMHIDVLAWDLDTMARIHESGLNSAPPFQK